MAQPNLDIAENMTLLEPYLPVLSKVVRRGFSTYTDKYSDEVKAAHDSAAAAKCIHRHILDELAIGIDGLSGLAIVDARGLMLLNVHDRAVLRFKKWMRPAIALVTRPTKRSVLISNLRYQASRPPHPD